MKTKNRTPMTQRLLGAVDLMVDLSTLGEYGLAHSPPATVREPCAARPRSRAVSSRRRTHRDDRAAVAA